MRALIFSDIHNNIDHVRLLRSRERNDYDLIIVAGDIGDKITFEFLEIVETFSCPTYFVYGNWDNQSEYGISLPRNCFLLNQSIERCGEYFIAGFSGCLAHWGCNPIYKELQSQVQEKHAVILGQYNNAQKIFGEAMRQFETKIEALNQAAIARYPNKGKRYEAEIWKIMRIKEDKFKSLYKPVAKVKRTTAYTKYEEDLKKVRLKAADENRKALIKKIEDVMVPQDKLILVTHERLFRLADDGIVPLLHVYGHVHEYRLTSFKGTWYLNAAALDNGTSGSFGKKGIHPEGYCVVKFSGSSISVERRLLSHN